MIEVPFEIVRRDRSFVPNARLRDVSAGDRFREKGNFRCWYVAAAAYDDSDGGHVEIERTELLESLEAK